MKYPTWLKRLVLPYEFEDHPLYYDKAAVEAEQAELDALWEEVFGPGKPAPIIHQEGPEV